MKLLPPELSAIGRTDLFTEANIPKGLLKDHRTSPNVWAKIVILEGELTYTIQSDPAELVKLSKDRFGVVEPEILHFVQPQGKVLFYVEFYK